MTIDTKPCENTTCEFGGVCKRRKYEDTAHWERRRFCCNKCRYDSMKGMTAWNKGVREDLATRFWRLVDRSAGPDKCWPFLGTKTEDGYGGFQIEGRKVLAHRVAWELVNGPIPEHDSFHGNVVRHVVCDWPSCQNPAHMALGLQADNISDRDTKGRRADTHGEGHPGADLTNADVLEIRRLVASGKRQRDVGEMFGVSPSNMSMIINRKTWTHI